MGLGGGHGHDERLERVPALQADVEGVAAHQRPHGHRGVPGHRGVAGDERGVPGAHQLAVGVQRQVHGHHVAPVAGVDRHVTGLGDVGQRRRGVVAGAGHGQRQLTGTRRGRVHAQRDRHRHTLGGELGQGVSPQDGRVVGIDGDRADLLGQHRRGGIEVDEVERDAVRPDGRPVGDRDVERRGDVVARGHGEAGVGTPRPDEVGGSVDRERNGLAVNGGGHGHVPCCEGSVGVDREAQLGLVDEGATPGVEK